MNQLLLIFFLIFPFAVPAQKYNPVDAGSKVHFTIKNFGISTGGDFTGLKGEISFNPQDLTNSDFDVSVSVATIDTDNESRDENLRSDEYFNAVKFPSIRMKSVKINKTSKTNEGYYYFTGNLTIRDSTHQISFPFKAEKLNENYRFTGEFEINRLHYNIGEQSMVLSDNVKISLNVIAKRK